jgi:1-acyl-sn-glycerol-3-phosphate acyltransferase
MLRKFLHWGIGFLFRLLSRLEVVGLENVPPKGGTILATNHLSVLDPPLVFAIVERDDATAIVTDKHKKNPVFRWVVDAVNGIWINREEADFAALRQSRDYLQKGGFLGIAPEGTRSHTGGMIPTKTGIAFLADKADVPILPAAITGTESAIDQLKRLRRPRIKIQFGELFKLPPVDRKNREADLQNHTDEIMCRIAIMLPPEYRGVYADHPRLKELLGEGNQVIRQPREKVVG